MSVQTSVLVHVLLGCLLFFLACLSVFCFFVFFVFFGGGGCFGFWFFDKLALLYLFVLICCQKQGGLLRADGWRVCTCRMYGMHMIMQHFSMTGLQAIKNWRRERPGNEASSCSFVPIPVIVIVWERD